LKRGKRSLISILRKTQPSSKITTFAKIVKTNTEIFSKQYPQSPNENMNHYISKIYIGENIKRFRNHLTNFSLNYEYEKIPTLATSMGDRSYVPDIFIEYLDHDARKKHIIDIEILGGVHFKNQIQLNKNKLRRETLINYFQNQYKDPEYTNYKTIFSYIGFQPEQFLYHRLDFFFDIYDQYRGIGGAYPSNPFMIS
jgi:hypothetical protein